MLWDVYYLIIYGGKHLEFGYYRVGWAVSCGSAKQFS